MKLSSILVGLPLLVTDLASGYANPEKCKGICGNAHDPSIIRRDEDSKYFRFSTGRTICVYTAPDLTGPWKDMGNVLPHGSKVKLKGQRMFWAPDVQKVGDMYYLYYSLSSYKSQNSAIGLARSKTMDIGTWTDVGSVGITSDSSKQYNAIDPNLFKDNDQYYLNFGSSWLGIHQVQMDSDPTKLAVNVVPQQSAFTLNNEVREGAYEFAYKGYYYLFFSQGICCELDKKKPAKGKEYRILVCRSKSPTAEFVDKNGIDCRKDGGSVVLESHDHVYAPGGQGVYKDPKYGPVLYYHYVDTRVGYADSDKLFGWNKLDFSSGWPVVKSLKDSGKCNSSRGRVEPNQVFSSEQSP
ncbi:unnamed protein product [Peronospora farinosa]|uniref:arabinan endo-1,5-alpha-L-arabinosidase n=1 Tax=Peronospora farinosa TaxID=134698 RepID=A0ABN8C5S0_9STRA|nr:unnamed protein product [Peronospora farinosa]